FLNLNWDLLFSILKEWANDSKTIEILKSKGFYTSCDEELYTITFGGLHYDELKEIMERLKK
ncbi:MAG: hypothetical protein K6G28_04655, partial [Acholeplasmatales bacterium]|nr:hypothetical protein [Acholeplasmatales bacterium]